MEDIRQILAQNISNLRTDRKMTQLELAEILNYSDKAVSKWERGESLPDIITLKAIADLFGVNVDYLITEHHPDEKRKGSHISRNNRIFISLISVVGVWILGTAVFSISSMLGYPLWIAFLACVPVSCLVLMIFNSIWGKPKLNLLCISAMMWSALVTLYVSFLVYTEWDIWALLLVGIPIQLALSLGLGIRKPKAKSEKEVSKLIETNRKKKKNETETAPAETDPEI